MMTQPTPLAPERLKSELNVNGTYIDITDDVRGEAGITIGRGRKNEAGKTNTTCDFTINNHDGVYSDRNPLSPYFGLLGRNTLFRQSVPGYSYLRTERTTAAHARRSDAASLDITGDIDIRIECQWASYSEVPLAAKWDNTGQRSWALYTNADKDLIFAWSTDGSSGTVTALASVPIPVADGERLALRYTLDADNGAGSQTHTMYYSDRIDGDWTIISQFNNGTPTSIFSSTATLDVGNIPALIIGSTSAIGRTYRFELRNGINGTLVADPNFSELVDTEEIFPDSFANWSLLFGASIIPSSTRCVVEIPTWPQEWDNTGNDIWTPVQGAGIFRRVSAGSNKPLNSVLYRQIEASNPLYHWPLNEGTLSVEGSPAVGDTTMKVVNGHAAWGSTEIAAWIEPSVGADDGGELSLDAEVLMTDTGQWTFDSTFRMGTDVLTTYTLRGSAPATATTARTDWVLTVNGIANTVALSRTSVQPDTSSTSNVSTEAIVLDNAVVHHIRLNVSDGPGNDVDWEIIVDGTILDMGTTSIAGLWQTFRKIEIRSVGSSSEPNGLSNLAVWNTTPGSLVYYAAYAGWAGETVAARIERLCSEQNIEFTLIGEANDTPRVGPQLIDSFLNLLDEAVKVDLGVLFEPRYIFGIGYRTRESLYNQTESSTLQLDYSLGHLSGSVRPLEDDLPLLNDSKVTRVNGGFSRVVLESGRLSIQEPPNGVGVYDEAIDVIAEVDAQCLEIAGHRLLLGTWDEARYTALLVELNRTVWLNSTALSQRALDIDIGDPITLDNVLSPPMPPDLVELLAQGSTEFMDNFRWRIGWNTVPGGPYKVATVDGEERVCGDLDMVLASDATSTATSLFVESVSGSQQWATPLDDAESADDFPMPAYVGGELVTITDADDSDPQELTVVRSVNGIVKAQTTGTVIEVAQPARVGW